MTPRFRGPRTAAAVLLLAAVRLAPAQTDTAAGPARSSGDAVYTAAQAERGAAQFRASCANCHVPSQFRGATFLRSWAGHTVYDLFAQIRSTMPFDNPGQLSREAYADVLAYVFRLNGLPAGARELPSDDARLKQLRIPAPPDTAGPPPRKQE
ncbi:MAG: c-type cytochrome [Gemmatimonadales bacterium]